MQYAHDGLSCEQNVRAFLHACKTVFSMNDCDLFDPCDLIDESQGFGKVPVQSAIELSCIIAFIDIFPLLILKLQTK